MRKILTAILLVALAATSSFGASLAVEADGVYADAGKSVFPNVLGSSTTQSTTAIGKLSTGVYFAWQTTTTGYALATQHNSGVRAFGTASDSTAITWMTVSKGGTLAKPGTPNALAVSGAGWTVM